jgi:membrane protein implicated in regulation of membrane protease activity
MSIFCIIIIIAAFFIGAAVLAAHDVWEATIVFAIIGHILVGLIIITALTPQEYSIRQEQSMANKGVENELSRLP